MLIHYCIQWDTKSIDLTLYTSIPSNSVHPISSVNKDREGRGSPNVNVWKFERNSNSNWQSLPACVIAALWTIHMISK